MCPSCNFSVREVTLKSLGVARSIQCSFLPGVHCSPRPCFTQCGCRIPIFGDKFEADLL